MTMKQSAKKLSPLMRLNSGYDMPVVGLGTYAPQNPKNLKDVLRHAIKVGYRHIDTSYSYHNEKIIGEVIKEAIGEGVCTREELFITTKLWHTQKSDVSGSIVNALNDLGLDYLDLYLINYMRPDWDWDANETKSPATHEVWADMESGVRQGMIKSIGVSNCPVSMLWDMLCYAEIKPSVHQMELHPYFQQEKVVEWHKKNDIGCIAYTPLGQYAWKVIDERHRGVKCVDDEVIKKIAADNGKTPAQIILNWNIQRDVFVIPKTFKIDRLEENFNCFDFKLTDAEYKQIDELERNLRLRPIFNMGLKDWNVPFYS